MGSPSVWVESVPLGSCEGLSGLWSVGPLSLNLRGAGVSSRTRTTGGRVNIITLPLLTKKRRAVEIHGRR